MDTPVLAVNFAAITSRGKRKVVFLMQDNKVTETPVELGQSLGGSIEIKEGLSSGDKVVVRPSESLRSGTRVKVRE